MDKKLIITKVEKIVREKLLEETSGHDFWHCQRVAKMALRIGREEKVDLFVLALAGFLHDIDVKRGRNNHHLRSALRAGKILAKLGVDQKIINRVQEAIRAHSFRGARENPAKTMEAKIISDADKLDVMGALGVARVCSFSGYFRRPLHLPNHKFNPQRYTQKGGKTAIGAFYEKIFLLPKVLHTKMAKKIGAKRLEFAHEFVKKFLEEWEGK